MVLASRTWLKSAPSSAKLADGDKTSRPAGVKSISILSVALNPKIESTPSSKLISVISGVRLVGLKRENGGRL